MLGSAVSSSTPNDFQSNSHKGVVSRPVISRQAMPAPPGMAYTAVGMQRALDSAIGLPSRSTSASWMPVLVRFVFQIRRLDLAGRTLLRSDEIRASVRS